MSKGKPLSSHIEKKEDKYFVGSREKLKAAMRHKIKKTFVSCLEAVESELSQVGVDTTEVFSRIRKRVLTVGNDQIRNMEADVERYNVEYIPYHVKFILVEEGEG